MNQSSTQKISRRQQNEYLHHRIPTSDDMIGNLGWIDENQIALYVKKHLERK